MNDRSITPLDLRWMNRAIQEAKRSAESGGSPFGAVVAYEEILLSTGYNQTIATNIKTRHAELIAIEQAQISEQAGLLTKATLYSSCAPCMMCLGAAFYSGIRRIIYAVSIADVIKFGSEDPPHEPNDLNQIFGLGMIIEGDVLKDNAMAVIVDVFQNRGYL